MKKQKRCNTGDAVPISMLRSVDHTTYMQMVVVASVGGDASGTAWSVLNIFKREALMIHMPAALQAALRSVQHRDPDDVQRLFMISIAEHMVLLFAQYQWGGEWADYGIVLYNTDNQNSHSAAMKKFSGNEIMQDLCRLSCMLEFALKHFVQSVWWPTWTNLIGDTISRMLDSQGKVIPAVRREFAILNGKLK